ncbi:MAG TPA: hypothetical protein ENJ54_03780 [Chloroflexi bacterium]|nr:hypothetical protein [Chloroflexota bacterium]
MPQITLSPHETLLRKDRVSLVEGRIAARTGVCYLTSHRIVVLSESVVAGAAAAVSIIARTLLRKSAQLGTRRQEIALKGLTRISFSKYGLNQSVDIPLGDGTTLRMVMNKKQRQQWLGVLEDALRAQGLMLALEGEATWRVRPAG